MAKKIKLQEEEIKALTDIQNKFNALQKEFGTAAITRIDIDAREERAEDFLSQLRNAEVEIAKALEEKYGRGTVSLETGEFNSLK